VSRIGELSKVWQHCYRILVPGGRLVCVVGDVCLSRRKHGRHVVVPLHSDIAVSCRKIGFDNLNPIIWFKIAKVTYEVNNGTKFFGKPYEPNAIIKKDEVSALFNKVDLEFIKGNELKS
jgi:site-specific DNA-methyltransferase (adenine-specific)